MDKIKIIFEPDKNKPFLVIYKPKNLPSAPLNENDKDNALSQAIQIFPEIQNVTGKKQIEYGLLHRLDTATDGLLLICTTQECYDFLTEQQKLGKFVKYYTAKCDILPENAQKLGGFPENRLSPHFDAHKTYRIESFFRSFSKGNKEVRPVTSKSPLAVQKKVGTKKNYTTNVTILQKNEDFCLVECKISQGFRHQVRCHLGWIGLPIQNDKLYNYKTKLMYENSQKEDVTKKNHPQIEDDLSFTATKIEFEYPKGDLNSYEIAFTWT